MDGWGIIIFIVIIVAGRAFISWLARKGREVQAQPRKDQAEYRASPQQIQQFLEEVSRGRQQQAQPVQAVASDTSDESDSSDPPIPH